MAAVAIWIRGTVRFLAGENGLADIVAGDKALSSLDSGHRSRIEGLPFGRVLDRHSRQAGLVWWHGFHGRSVDALNLAETLGDDFPPSRHGQIDRAMRETGKAFALATLGRNEEARASFVHARSIFREYSYDFYVTTSIAYELYLLDLPYFTEQVTERRRKRELLTTFASNDLQELVQIPPEVAIAPLLLIEGEWDAFTAIAESVRQQPRSIFVWNYAIPTLAFHAHYCGRAERAWELLRMALPLGSATNIIDMGVPLRSLEGLRLGVELALDAGDLDEAEAWLEAHDAGLRWSGYEIGKAASRLLHARLTLAHGDTAAARLCAREALQLAQDPRQPLELIAVHRWLAMLDMAEGRMDDANEHVRQSLRLAKTCAAPYEEALSRFVAAQLHYVLGELERAEAQLEAVITTSEVLRASPLLEKARALLTEVRQPASAAPLSPRELDVLTLVAEGLTDRKVAEQLFISPRTVNQHLRSTYNKLGVNSRAAATRKAIELGLLDTERNEL